MVDQKVIEDRKFSRVTYSREKNLYTVYLKDKTGAPLNVFETDNKAQAIKINLAMGKNFNV